MTAYPTPESLERVLSRLVRLLPADPAFLRASRGRHFAFCIRFSDHDAAFYGILRDGEVLAGLGPPPDPPTIEVTVHSQVFHDVFSGRVNPVRVVMRGDLAFSGSAADGLRFQGLVPDFSRLYRRALAQTG